MIRIEVHILIVIASFARGGGIARSNQLEQEAHNSEGKEQNRERAENQVNDPEHVNWRRTAQKLPLRENNDQPNPGYQVKNEEDCVQQTEEHPHLLVPILADQRDH